ncbi:MAG: hypothetical protein AAFT19_09535, partial [Pseudomonadota bacterium]
MALFLSIWVSALVATIVIGVTRDTRSAALIAGNERSIAEAGTAAEAGIERLALSLLAEAVGERLVPSAAEAAMPRPRPGAGRRPIGAQSAAARYEALPVLGDEPGVGLDGRRYRLSFGETLLILTAQAETGKVDLNRADPTVLTTLLTQLDPIEG